MATQAAQQKQRDLEDEEMATEAESDVTIQAERYSYTELKEAQRRCGEKAVAAALQECGTSSTAQQKVFQAHVNDLCASIFIAVVRQYDPDTKEDMEPVDKDTVAKLAALEKRLKEKEAAVKELREQVPQLAAEKMRKQLEKSRKRSADVELTSVTLSERAGAPEGDLRKDLVDDFQREYQVVRSDQPDNRDSQSGRASYEATEDNDRRCDGAESSQDTVSAQRTGKTTSSCHDAPNASSNAAKQTGAPFVYGEERDFDSHGFMHKTNCHRLSDVKPARLVKPIHQATARVCVSGLASEVKDLLKLLLHAQKPQFA